MTDHVLMAGKRLLDAARLFSASRNVAQQHFKIRSEQLDVWSKTSSLAKGVKNQTDRVTLTAQAASALAKRFAEDSPIYDTQSRATQDEQGVPRQESIDHKSEDTTDRQGLKQDHHYRGEEENATSETTKEDDLSIQQEKPSRYPTPDATIPPHDAPVNSAAPTAHAPEIHGRRADEAPPKGPVEHGQAEEVKPAASPASTIDQQRRQSDEVPKQEAIPEQDDGTEGINTDIFHSPRVSQLLGNKPNSERAKQEMALKGQKKTDTGYQEVKKGQEQDMKHAQRSQLPGGEAEPKSGSSSKFSNESPQDMEALAADLAKDAETPTAQPQVSISLNLLAQAKLIH